MANVYGNVYEHAEGDVYGVVFALPDVDPLPVCVDIEGKSRLGVGVDGQTRLGVAATGKLKLNVQVRGVICR